MYMLIDSYDSFTYNLFHYFQELGADVLVVRNDQITVDEVMARAPEGIILSPGPGRPDNAGILPGLIPAAAGKIPVLGVCLGHQAMAQAFGGRIIRAPQLMHGKTSAIYHTGASIFQGLPSPYTATRYHSLIVERESLPACFDVTAETEDGVIMGIAHRDYPLYGVQFHPESIATEHGHALLENFLKLSRQDIAA